ncbi:hypothetical protein NEOKW01_1535 [Nematocida sp. AWRm80]|nr:hypothetical protein NEOKW01_1535 [Nematocida sp. AWRm80]
MENDCITIALKQEISRGGEVAATKTIVRIGGVEYPGDLKTAYSNSRKVPYTLRSIVYLYETRDKDHGEYISICRDKEIDPVSFLDRERILSDLFVAPVDNKITISIPFRSEGELTTTEILTRYDTLLKERSSEAEYIVIPRTEIDLAMVVLLDNPITRRISETEIEASRKRYKIIYSPTELEDSSRIAAVFLDGTSWQFNHWPKHALDKALAAPMFYLHQKETNPTLPKLPRNVTILDTNTMSKIEKDLVSTAFWTIIHHSCN